MHKIIRKLPAVFFFALYIFPAFALETKPEVTALAAVLMDAKTGTVLYQKNPSLPHPPASLTKVMTIHILLEKIASGELSLNQEIRPPRESWAVNLPRDSSLMFLGPDQRLTLLDLLKGLAVPSGNDAAIAAAILSSGSVSAFAGLMNEEARKADCDGLFFVEPSGYDAHNRITALDFARFLTIYIDRHPEALAMLHSIREFTYPRTENLLEGNGSNPITQTNRNALLFSYPDTDGIKTGYLDESGYNIALTAQRGDTRLILVLLGEKGSTPQAGIRARDRDSTRLLDFGFDNFTTQKVSCPAPQAVRVWKSGQKEIIPASPSEILVTIPKGTENRLKGEISQTLYITAPVKKGDILGTLRVSLDEKTLYEGKLTCAEEIPRGSWWDIFTDSIIIFFRELFGYPV
ncbi:MAG: D-alanyl-D-alanine carboxypeptidase [Spirochaetales bacterium]|jgi:D-alanyl-D-alanine carboxypeptidase (penicillin-binding protein 5/6)|nr:D-alanyl-D-alanine carboxypeptidase [Spirochaetales bacterium]